MSTAHRNPWIPLLSRLPLSRTEKAVFQRFVADPAGRSFLAVSDILRSHRRNQEALELLVQGVQDHPQFLVARVVLAREYLNQGMVGEAWQTILDAPANLNDNVLAQKLKLKLSVLMLEEEIFEETSRLMQKQQMLDHECRELVKSCELEGLEAASQSLQSEWRQKGVELWIPDAVKSRNKQFSNDETLDTLASAKIVEISQASIEEKVVSKEIPNNVSARDGDGKQSFHVMSLAEVFQGGDDKGWSVRTVGGIELDSTTLGEIYARQGHFAKSLAVYKRLLHVNPSSEMLRARVLELGRLEREQRDQDQGVDPELLDVMESTDQLDRKMKYYQTLLDRLGS